MIRSLTYVDQSQLKGYLPLISEPGIKDLVRNILNIPKNAPLRLLQNLADLVVATRETVAAKEITPEEAVNLINLNVSPPTCSS